MVKKGILTNILKNAKEHIRSKAKVNDEQHTESLKICSKCKIKTPHLCNSANRSDNKIFEGFMCKICGYSEIIEFKINTKGKKIQRKKTITQF